MPKFLRVYKLLLSQFIEGSLSADEFSQSYLVLFLQEKDMSEEYFTVLQDLFEDSDSYSPLWTKDDEEQHIDRITEETLRHEAITALEELDKLP